MKALKLIPKKASDHAPNRITVMDEQAEVATVYCDQLIKFTGSQLSLSEVKEITAIAENFNLFYYNLIQP